MVLPDFFIIRTYSIKWKSVGFTNNIDNFNFYDIFENDLDLDDSESEKNAV